MSIHSSQKLNGLFEEALWPLKLVHNGQSQREGGFRDGWRGMARETSSPLNKEKHGDIEVSHRSKNGFSIAGRTLRQKKRKASIWGSTRDKPFVEDCESKCFTTPLCALTKSRQSIPERNRPERERLVRCMNRLFRKEELEKKSTCGLTRTNT